MRLKTACAACALVGACAAFAVPLPQETVERWYSTGVYPPIQRALTQFSNLSHFALLDALLVCLPIVWTVLVARDVRRSARRWTVLSHWALRTVVAAATFYLMFLFAWGLNYRRVPLERKLRFDAGAVTPAAARDAAQVAVSRLNALYAGAHASTAREDHRVDAALAAAFARATKELGASGTTVPARPKYTLLDLYFRPAAVAGMTDPFFLETLVESDLLPVERPFVIAHELAHVRGYPDEGDANLVAVLATILSDNPKLQYSGWLQVWIYVRTPALDAFTTAFSGAVAAAGLVKAGQKPVASVQIAPACPSTP